MKRRALIIFCDNTGSGELSGPPYDNSNFREFLESYAGGEWYFAEIRSLQNPTKFQVSNAVNNFLSGADYTFIIFTGHGFINTDDRKRQYIELKDADSSILTLRTDAKRQTLIVDACRGFYSPTGKQLVKGFSDLYESLETDNLSTRKMFDKAVLESDEGWTVLFAASENETALDTDEGAAYLLCLLEASKNWETNNNKDNVLRLDVTHNKAKILLSDFDTIQIPMTNAEKRKVHFPFAVKYTPL